MLQEDVQANSLCYKLATWIKVIEIKEFSNLENSVFARANASYPC